MNAYVLIAFMSDKHTNLLIACIELYIKNQNTSVAIEKFFSETEDNAS